MSTFNPQSNRDASPTIRGYVYQVHLTIERWLGLQPNEILDLERGEDIDLVSYSGSGKEKRKLEQVKDYAKNVTLRSAVNSIAYFIEHRQNNRQTDLLFRYTTTAKIGKEQDLPEKFKKKPGIVIWEQLRKGCLEEIPQTDALQGIREILMRDVKKPPDKLPINTWECFCQFVKNETDEALLDLISKFEWNTEALELKVLRQKIIKALIDQQSAIADGRRAQEQYEILFFYVFHLLSESGVKQLTVEDRNIQLSLPRLSEEKRQTINSILSKVDILGSRVDSLEQTVSRFTSQINDYVQRLVQEQGIGIALNSTPPPLDLSVPLLVDKLSPREETVNSLLDIVTRYTWTAIHGIAGSGKTHLAILIVHRIGTCQAWVRLRGLSREQASQQLDAVCRQLTELPRPSNRYEWYCQVCERLGNGAILVLDDLPELSGRDEVSEQLVQLTRACRLHGVRLLTTSPYELLFSLQDTLSDSIVHSSETPPFSDREAAEVLLAYGAPIAFLNKETSFLNALFAQGHPVLLVAVARYLRQHDWQMSEEIQSGLFQGEYRNKLNREIEKWVFDSLEDKNARELLYRLSLPVGSFSLNEVQALASVNPVLDRPGELLNALVGLWVQQDVKSRFSISPLVNQLSEINLLPETKKSCNQVLAALIISKRKLSSLDIEKAIIHFLQAEAFNSAGLMLMQALQMLNSMDVLVDDQRLLSLWGSLPLPEPMDLDIRLLLRGLQIATRHKYGQDISYLIKDLDKLISQASENQATAVVFCAIITSSVLGINEPILANRHLRTALKLLPQVHNLRIPDTNELAFPNGLFLEFAIWINGEGITTIEHLQDWISTVEQLTAEQRQWAFTHEVAELGCLIVSENVWLHESEKPKEQQNWSAVLAAYEYLTERAYQLKLELLWACAVLSQIIILGEHRKDISAALTVARTAIAEASNDPRVQFLIKQGIGRQCVYANRNDEGLTWLSQALGEDTNAYPTARMMVMISMSYATGSRDPRLSVQFAQQAVSLAETTCVDKSDLVKALGELAIAQWLAGDLVSAFEPWDKAGEHLFACKSDTDDWKELCVRYGHVSGYFASLASTGYPPTIGRRSGQPYAAPQRGIFFAHTGIAEYYDRNNDLVIVGQLAMFADAVGHNQRAATWALRGIDEAKSTNHLAYITVLSQYAIPYLLLGDHYAEVLDLAIDAGAFLSAGIHQAQTHQVSQEFDFDVEAILGNKPSELWRQAEHHAALVGLFPIVFHISKVALHNPELAHTKAIKVAAICRQISATAVDQKLWVTAAELLEQMNIPEISYETIITRSQTFDPERDVLLRVIGNFVATLKNDISLEESVRLHRVIAPFIYINLSKVSVAYHKVMIPFFIDYWTTKLDGRLWLLNLTQSVKQILNQAERLSEDKQLQFILVVAVLSLQVEFTKSFTQWIMDSAPEVVSFLESL